MQKNNNALFFTCSLIEYISRNTKNHRSDVVLYLGDNLKRIYNYADVFHCEPIEKVSDDFIQRASIPLGSYDNISNCKYTVPDYWDIGEVFARLIEDCYEENDVMKGIKEVYQSWLSEKKVRNGEFVKYQEIVKQVREKQNIELSQLEMLLGNATEEETGFLYAQAREVADEVYGIRVFKRGLIEFTNYCKNDCYYCGISRSNSCAERYRLDKETILSCCEKGYALGYRTFVLQGGEDGYFTDERVCEIVSEIRENYPDCAITLSIGEKSKESYQKYFDAGADRYLLRHETANEEHYGKLHPAELSLRKRKQCLYDLKEIGYQVGCGFMVGSPYQTMETLYEDLMFIKELEPHMVGIGPFIPQKETPFAEKNAGTLEMTLRLLAIIRLMHPQVLLPATTALGTIDEQGRELGILAGANVVMPNLSPMDVREKYKLYDQKACTGDEAVEGDRNLQLRMKAIGYELVCDRGDYKIITSNK